MMSPSHSQRCLLRLPHCPLEVPVCFCWQQIFGQSTLLAWRNHSASIAQYQYLFCALAFRLTSLCTCLSWYPTIHLCLKLGNGICWAIKWHMLIDDAWPGNFRSSKSNWQFFRWHCYGMASAGFINTPCTNTRFMSSCRLRFCNLVHAYKHSTMANPADLALAWRSSIEKK